MLRMLLLPVACVAAVGFGDGLAWLFARWLEPKKFADESATIASVTPPIHIRHGWTGENAK
jgi:hypothetical protein